MLIRTAVVLRPSHNIYSVAHREQEPDYPVELNQVRTIRSAGKLAVLEVNLSGGLAWGVRRLLVPQVPVRADTTL